MADLESKVPAGCVAVSGDPNAQIERRKVTKEQMSAYVAARIMVAHLQDELKTSATGQYVKWVGMSHRGTDFEKVRAAMAVIRRLAETLESADSVLSQFEPIGGEPNDARVLYCEALEALLGQLGASP